MSYFVVGIVGVLTYRIPRPWRWVYLATIVLLVGGALVRHPDFTPLGRFCALLVGLACYPLTRRHSVPAAA